MYSSNMKKNFISASLGVGLASILLIAVAAENSGCVAVVAGAGTGAAVAYVRGQLETTIPHDFESVAAATNRAIQQLQFAKVSEHKDALLDTFIVRSPADKKIEIRLENSARELTKVRIRIGVFGNEPLSLTILEKIKSNL